jgi:hypothetical protein
MSQESRLICRVRRCVSAIAVFALASSVEAQNGTKKFLTKPLTIEDQGSFFIGGVPKVTNYATLPPANNPNQTLTPNQITIGQMYVQFQIPARKRQSPPVIMVHGSTHTGAALESTPDGREGWAPYFVRQGVSTYVVDQAGRGRSGFDQSVIHEAVALIRSGQVEKGLAMIPTFGRITDNGAWTAWFGHLLPAGSTILNGTLSRHGDPNDPPTDDANHANNYFPTFPLTVDPRIAARTGAIAAAPAGPPNYYALEYYKQLVPNAEVTLPGSTCATCEPTQIAPANTWTPLALADLVEKLNGAIVATHSQSGIMGHHMARILKERGKLDLLKGLITVEGSCSLPNSGLKAEDFDNIPYMAIKGDYTALSEVCRTTVDAINARRTADQGIAKAEYIKLDEHPNPAFKGSTHMMMLDTTSSEIAELMLKWVGDNVPPKSKKGKK